MLLKKAVELFSTAFSNAWKFQLRVDPSSNSKVGLSAGPGQDDSYADLRSDYQKNEVAVDYNAGFTGLTS